jgi:hypothetical protein
VPSDARKHQNATFASAASFLALMYTEIVFVAVQPFRLIALPDGRTVMKAAPYITAWSAEHIGACVVPGVLAGVAFVLAAPAMALLHLRALKRRHLLADEDSLERFRWLYGKYQARAWYWEIASSVLTRRLVLVAVAVGLDAWPFTQALVALMFLVTLMCAQFYTRPYRRPSNNVTDTLFMALLTAVCFAGLLFSVEVEFPDFVAALVVLGLAAGIGVATWKCAKEIASTVARRRAEQRLRLPDEVSE